MSRQTDKKKALRRLIVPVQAAVSCSLLVWLFSRPDFSGNLLRVIASASPGWLAAGFLLAGAVQLLCLIRWRIFLRMAGVRTSLRESGGIFFAGLFCNLFLPGGAGGDVVKIGFLAARGHDPGRSALSVVMDRLAGSVSMVLAAAVLMTWRLPWLTTDPAVAGLIRVIALYLGALAILIGLSVALSAGSVTARLPAGWPGRAKLRELSGVYFECAVQWPRTLVALAVSAVMLTAFFMTYYLSARAYGENPGLLNFLALMPTVDIIAGLPMSLGGLGVRESVFTLLLGNLAGVAGPTAVAISLAGYLMSALWGIPGAFLWLFKSSSP